MNVIKEENAVPIFSWCPEIEQGAWEQMRVIARLPFVKHCAIMPDGHLGDKMPIGGVVACENVIVPSFVGSDIGCGLCAIKTSLKKSEIEDEEIRKKILHSLFRGIPVGFHHNSQKRELELKISLEKEVDISEISKYDYNPLRSAYCEPTGDAIKAVFEQIGTLGSGNHFCEIQYDENDFVWVMIHSGSRNIGLKVGDYFNDMAVELNKKWHSKVTDIPFLPADSFEGESYLAWMNFALCFAYMNRRVMMQEVMKTLNHEFSSIEFITDQVVDDTVDGMINIHHNFFSLEHHFGKNYYIHRKGATMARKGMTGIIPGSMGTFSYIVKGLGEQKSMTSCSHGAGRKMGRKEFCRQMKGKLDEVKESLKGVVYSEFGKIEHGSGKGEIDCSEAPGAYKDIESVINEERDLVEPIVKLRPLICLKG